MKKYLPSQTTRLSYLIARKGSLVMNLAMDSMVNSEELARSFDFLHFRVF
jgi:hypothetical protein